MKTRAKYGYLEGIVSVIGNIVLFVLKYWAGVVSGSVALIADAWHTLSDSLSSIIVITGVKLSSKKATRKHPFGYGRWEEISSIFIGFLLSIIAYEFIRESIEKFNSHESANFGTIAIIVTIISILGKEGLAQYAFYAGRKSNNSTVKADAWHHRSDAFSSIIILAGIFLKNYFWWIDSFLGIAVALMLFYAVYDIIRKAIDKILGEKPSETIIEKINEIISSVSNEAHHPHHFHIHNYGEHQELTFHMRFNPDIDIKAAHDLATKIEKMIAEQMSIIATIHIEPKHY